MPFQIVRNDITAMAVDAIVNTTNPDPTVGYGVDMGIHHAAGPQLLTARRTLGTIPVGSAGITPAFDLPAKYVIHTVCPLWQGGDEGEAELLARCYTRSMALADEHGCQSVAFPLMSAGNLGFPKTVALQTAMSAISHYLMDSDLMVYLVVFSRESFALSEKLFSSVASFIDENYIAETIREEYHVDTDRIPLPALQRRERRRREALEEDMVCCEEILCEPTPTFSAAALDDLLEHLDAGFSETLLQLIDRSGKTDAQVYKKANIDRKLFSKIRNNPGYRPTKATALAFAIALELSHEDTEMLLERAGYALSRASKFDVIVEYFIRSGNYDIFELNEVLFAFDQPLIGG